MSLQSFDELFATADGREAPVPVVAIGGADRTVLEALTQARERGWVSPVVAGREADIRSVAEEAGLDLDGFRVLDGEEPARAAVAEVRGGRAELLMKGRIATPELMRAVLDRETGLRTGRTICQTVLMELPRRDRRFLLADTGITIQPTLEQRAEIVAHVGEIARAVGAETPKVALMAATEKATEAMPDTLEAAELARRNREEGALGGCVVEGPLSIDLAFTREAGERKGVRGRIAGDADGLVFPNLQSANLTVKSLMYLAESRFGGVLAGVACPVVFMSRADETATRLNSLALALRILDDGAREGNR